MVSNKDIDIILKSPIDWELFCGKTILVTGATGRLGVYFAEALIEVAAASKLNIKIILLARNKEKLEKCFGDKLCLPNVYPLIQDITVPIRLDEKVDFIIHTAGLASPMDITHIPVDTIWGHVQGTRNILELARLQTVCRVLYISTAEVYGSWQSDSLISESDMGSLKCDVVRSCYPESKRLCETMLASYARQYGVEYISVRLSHTLGPGIILDDGRAFSQFIKWALDGEDIILQSDGSAMRTYTYTADAIGAALLALTKGENKEVYNIANVDNLISVRDLALLISELADKKISVRYANGVEAGLQYLPFKLGIMNIDKISSLGWSCYTDIRTTFMYTMESFR